MGEGQTAALLHSMAWGSYSIERKWGLSRPRDSLVFSRAIFWNGRGMPEPTAFDFENLQTAHEQKLKLAVSLTEAAAALGINPGTLGRLTKRGLLKPSRTTRRPLHPVWEIVRFLHETTAQFPSEP